MSRAKGFTLIEIAMVIVVMGLLFAMLAGMSASLVAQQRIQTTRSRLANIDNALALFVSQYKRLPCPADGRIASSTGGAEYNDDPVTPRTCTGNQQHGVVPWRALGLTGVDIEDGWGGRFTYRVGPELVVDNAMDFTSCDPAGTSSTIRVSPSTYCTPAGIVPGDCNAGNLPACTPPSIALRGAVRKGLVVKNVAGTVVMDPRGASGAGTDASTGAAYVVISHGAEGGGAYSSEGTLLASATAAGTMEAMNFSNLAYTPPVLSVAPTSFLVDDAFNAIGATHFDDTVSRPNILSVATRAQLGPRAR